MLTEVEKPGTAFNKMKKLQTSHLNEEVNRSPISYSNGSSQVHSHKHNT